MDESRQRHIQDLHLKAVDPASPIPLYHQIEADLRDLILSGDLAPNDLLPPEVDLSEVYRVGRHTVRMALARLSAENLIVRKAGRGTVVRPRDSRMTFYLDRSFTSQMADMGRTAHSQILSQTTGKITAGMGEPLQHKTGSPYLRLIRLRLGDNEPIGLQTSVIVTERCPSLLEYNFEVESLYDVLATHCQLAITEIFHRVSAVVADPEQAKLLAIVTGDPLLLVKTEAYLEDHELIEHSISYYRADKYEYSTRHTF